MQNKIVDPGTIILQQGTKYFTAMYDADKASLKAAKEDIEVDKINLSRFKHLSNIHAESVENYQQTINDYFNSIGNYIKCEGNLLSSKQFLDTRTVTAPFEGYVDKVLYTGGGLRAAGDPSALEVSQLNPIGIKIKMDRATARKINAKTPITVYLPNSDNVQGVYNGYSILTSDGIILITDNYLQKVQSKTKYKPEMVLNSFYPVDYFYIDSVNNKQLCVPEKALQKDNKGYFIWKAENRNFYKPKEKFDPIFKIQKVYLIPDNKKRLMFDDIYVQAIESSSNLKYGDVVLSSPPDKLHQGEIVAYSNSRYNIMPGEKIKVKIGE